MSSIHHQSTSSRAVWTRHGKIWASIAEKLPRSSTTSTSTSMALCRPRKLSTTTCEVAFRQLEINEYVILGLYQFVSESSSRRRCWYMEVYIRKCICTTGAGSVAQWLACWTQAQKRPGSNRSRDAVG